MQRYSSAKDELTHLLVTIVFNSFEIVYFTGFLPVKFIKPDTYLFFDAQLVLLITITCLLMTMILMCAHYLHKRAVEMQFNAKMCGSWEKVPKPNNPVQEWMPHTSYPMGTIVYLSREHHIEPPGKNMSNG